MGKKTMQLSRQAWNLLRMALLWARKGGAFRHGIMTELRLLPNCIKNLRHVNSARISLYYGEKEFSFDETPLFNFKLHRPSSSRFHMPNFPCIKPQVDFEYEFSEVDQDSICYHEARKSFLTERSYDDGIINSEILPVEKEGVDLKAEEFIDNFYRQIRMQRQISNLQYNETS